MIAIATLSTAATGEPVPLYPADAVLLLVAPWCAPCYGELARLDEIAAAAGPRAVRVMLIEDGPRATAMVRGLRPGQLWTASPRQMRQARADLLERAVGLPYSIVTDASGAICAGQGGGLDRARTAMLVKRCDR